MKAETEPFILDRLMTIHVTLYGDTPPESFWCWLDACGVGHTEQELEAFYETLIEDKP